MEDGRRETRKRVSPVSRSAKQRHPLAAFAAPRGALLHF